MSRAAFAICSCLLLLVPVAGFGQEAGGAAKPPDEIERIVVLGSGLDRDEILAVDPALPGSHAPDAARLLRRTPGGASLDNGPVSSQVQLRGLAGLRVNTQIDGLGHAPGGPNLMDPPLHYAPKPLLESLDVQRGIGSVSDGPGIGGHVNARLVRSEFSDDSEFALSGMATARGSSVDEAFSGGGLVAFANDRHRVHLLGHYESGDDTDFADGTILGSEYERFSVGLGYGIQLAPGHELAFEFRRHETDPTANPVFPLDIALFESDFYRAAYKGAFDDVEVALALGWTGIDHRMDNFQSRPRPAGTPITEVPARGESFSWKGSVAFPLLGGTLELGSDGVRSEQDATVTRPRVPGFSIGIFNAAETDRAGGFAEWRGSPFAQLHLEIGIRYDRVEMDAANVSAGPTPPIPAPVRALVAGFNRLDRERSDDNIDAVLKLRYELDRSWSLFAGVARKTRSPFYVERYAFLPLEVTAGLADGNNTIGHVALDPEEGIVFEGGFDWAIEGASLSVRGFYHRIDDFIQSTPFDATPTTLAAGVDPATALTSPLQGMAAYLAQFAGPGGVAPSGPVEIVSLVNGDATPLMFRNVDAELFGADAAARWVLAEGLWFAGDAVVFDGVLTWVRGKRRDIDDDLYRVTPLRTTLALSYEGAHWGVGVEGVLVRQQDHVSRTNGESESAGYGIVNLYAHWEPGDGVQITAGIENLFDKSYQDSLAGYNRVVGSDVRVFRTNAFAPLDPGARLPGPGIGGFLRVTYRF